MTNMAAPSGAIGGGDEGVDQPLCCTWGGAIAEFAETELAAIFVVTQLSRSSLIIGAKYIYVAAILADPWFDT